jgi:hypothetical protein
MVNIWVVLFIGSAIAGLVAGIIIESAGDSGSE